MVRRNNKLERFFFAFFFRISLEHGFHRHRSAIIALPFASFKSITCCHFGHFSITFIQTDSLIHPGHPFFRPAPHLSSNFSAVSLVTNASTDFKGFETLLSLSYASLENRHFALKFHCFHQLSTNLVVVDSRFPVSLGLFSLNKWPVLILTGPPFYFRRRTRLNLNMLLLLIIGGVEVDPGPSSSPDLTFGMLDTRSVVNKAPLLHSLITCQFWQLPKRGSNQMTLR